jgi:2-polyprenyl-6-methoxyphenol hydroxylase-like FAD-dependent oxidoreductase
LLPDASTITLARDRGIWRQQLVLEIIMAVELEKTPVLIAGAGPVGLAVAGDLGWRGIPCVVVEKSDGSGTQPKMDLLGVRTMEFCRRWGIVDWVENAGYERDHAQDCVYLSALTGGFEFGRDFFPHPEDEVCPPQSPQHRERQPQNFFDPVIARFARQFKEVDIRYHTELLGFKEHDGGVRAEVRNTQTGAVSTIEASYLAGCDGGGSVVRAQLGVKLPDSAVLTYTTNAIFRCRNLWELVDVKPGYRFIFIDQNGTWATLVAINGRDEYRFSFVGDGNKRALTEPELREAIKKAVGRDFEFDILSTMPWIRREYVADSYGTSRVFLVGDAAHLNSPTGAFGMNTGMQDAADIGWKLEGAIRGWAGPKLLQSYGIERRPVALRNVKEATANLKRMMSTREKKPPKEIFEYGTEGDRARSIFGAEYKDMMKQEWFTLGIHLGYWYENSPVIVPDGTPPPPDEVMTYTQTSRPGSRAPHVWLAPGKSTLDLFGREFVLLRFARDADANALLASAKSAGVPMRLIDIDNAEAAKLYERKLVLVRPDGHVGWRADALPLDCKALIDTVRGV